MSLASELRALVTLCHEHGVALAVEDAGLRLQGRHSLPSGHLASHRQISWQELDDYQGGERALVQGYVSAIHADLKQFLDKPQRGTL